MSEDRKSYSGSHPVVEQFLEICGIPRCSGHDDAIGAYLMDFARRYSLKALKDDAGNIMILHPGNEHTGIVLQAHQDMVPAVDEGVRHDFTADPIRYTINDGIITAEGTSLGADDGTGIAICLCALKDPLLGNKDFGCLFTVDEETTMKGIKELDPVWLSDFRYVMNIDNEIENEIVVGSAGSAHMSVTFSLRPCGTEQCRTLTVSGLTGGHSGTDIDEGRANAILLAAEFLKGIEGFRLSSISGGSAHNAIPASCSVTFSCPDDVDMDSILRDFLGSVRKRYCHTDPLIKMVLNDAGMNAVYDPASSLSMIRSLTDIPNGVIRKVPEGTITSSNIGTIVSGNGDFKMTLMTRSSVQNELDDSVNLISGIFENAGGIPIIEGTMSGWNEGFDTPLISKAAAVMGEVFGQAASIHVIHAGLECGELKNKCPHISAISIGPTVIGPHSTSEHTETGSIERTWYAVRRIISEGIL